jgi:hypothetical protein
MLPRPLLGIALTALLLSAAAGLGLARDAGCGSRDPHRGDACQRANDAEVAPVGVVRPAFSQPAPAPPPRPRSAPVLAPAGSPLAVLAAGAAAAALAVVIGAGVVARDLLVTCGAASSADA